MIVSKGLNEEIVLGRCKYFVETHVWERSTRLDPRGWLANFRESEKTHALHLLASFIFFSDELVKRMFAAAFQGLSKEIINSKDSFLAARAEWNQFLRTAYVLPVTGENPSPADSGHIFVRHARDILRIPEERLTNHSDALDAVLQDFTTPVVFVDDFVGSGEQFINTWNRTYFSKILNRDVSFSEIFRLNPQIRIFYCPLTCTHIGHDRIQSLCKGAKLRPAHIIDERYSAISTTSFVWPDVLQPTAYDFLESTSMRAGIPDTNGGEYDWRGFHMLALTISFAHGSTPPDATLPIFYWNHNGWNPLMLRP